MLISRLKLLPSLESNFRIPPLFGDVPRQTSGIRRKNNSRPSVWQGWEIGLPVRLQVKIKILMRKDEEPWSPAGAEKCCRWEEDLGYGWTDWRRENFHDRMRSFLHHFAFARFLHRCFSEYFRFLSNCPVQVVGGPAAATPQIQGDVRVVGECFWKVPPVLGSARWRWSPSPPPQMAREKSVRALGEEASAIS